MADRKNKAFKKRAPKKMPSTNSSRASAMTNAIAGENLFKQAVEKRLRKLFSCRVEMATQEQVYRAVCDAAMDIISENWLETKEAVEQQNVKTVYYMSLEFLVGRALGCNLINLGVRRSVREAMKELGIDPNFLEDQEPDPALGNGGLGRLASCFMESLSTLNYSAVGCGIRYHRGLFRQAVVDGYQNELPDDWLDGGYPFEVCHPEEARIVRFGGRVEAVYNDRKGGYDFIHRDCITVLAIPYDMPIVGYQNKVVNTLRLWDARAVTSDDQDYNTVMEQRRAAKQLTDVLYPDDSTDQGKELRLRQGYFFVSASLQSAVADFKKNNDDITKLPEKAVFQLNDTHPATAVAELMRILLDEEGLGWDDAWSVTTKCLAATNHTVLSEAMERWPVPVFSRLLPRIYEIIKEIDLRFVNEIEKMYPFDPDRVNRMRIIHDQEIRMANLCLVASFSMNGVAQIHTKILETRLFRDFYEIMPYKFSNKTNGVTHRRFLLKGNSLLAGWITGHIGPYWITDFSRIREMAAYADDEKAGMEFMKIRHCNKIRLAKYILAKNGMEIDPNSIYDVQVKRIHEFKRPMLFILYIIYRYNRIRQHPEDRSLLPRTFIIGGKAAKGYYMAKRIIKLINSVAEVINNDPSVKGRIKVVFIENYRVSNAEMIFAAADLSEQLSCAGFEASGTGCQKMMMNGCPLIATLDGANVEIVEEAGPENEFIFGLTADQIANYEQYGGYDPMTVFHNDSEIRQVLTQLVDGTFSPDRNLFKDIYDSLLTGYNSRPDRYFVLADLRSYIEAQQRVDEAYRDKKRWARMSILNMAGSGKFSSDRTIEEYAQEIWHLQKVKMPEPEKEEDCFQSLM